MSAYWIRQVFHFISVVIIVFAVFYAVLFILFFVDKGQIAQTVEIVSTWKKSK